MRLIRLLGYCALAYYVISAILPDQNGSELAQEISQSKDLALKENVDVGSQLISSNTSSTAKVPSLAIDPKKFSDIQALPKTVALKSTGVPVLSNPPKIQIAPDFVFVTGSRVNVRKGPSTQNAVVGAFSRGAKLVIHETSGGWSRVSGQSTTHSLSGWMASRFLSADKPAVQIVAPAPKKRRIAVPTSREVTQARKTLISQSIAGHNGNCACPYQRDRANRKCGKRSAWSKPGGYEPLCYDSDINISRLTSFFARQGKIWP